jgi:hypothetical protein
MYNIDSMGHSATSRSISVWLWVTASGFEGRIYGNSNPSDITTAPLNANSWTLVKTAVPIIGDSILVVSKISGNADPADYAYATGSIVVAGPKTYNFADGYSPNWIWNGTPDNSTSTGPLL